MGEAKKRGTYEKRKIEAIQQGRVKKRVPGWRGAVLQVYHSSRDSVSNTFNPDGGKCLAKKYMDSRWKTAMQFIWSKQFLFEVFLQLCLVTIFLLTLWSIYELKHCHK
jgi:hypothetical protein